MEDLNATDFLPCVNISTEVVLQWFFFSVGYKVEIFIHWDVALEHRRHLSVPLPFNFHYDKRLCNDI